MLRSASGAAQIVLESRSLACQCSVQNMSSVQFSGKAPPSMPLLACQFIQGRLGR